MLTLPDINRPLYSKQVLIFEPSITIRTGQRGCIVQVDCPGFKDEELSFLLQEDGLQMMGTPVSRAQGLPGPAAFNHRIPLEFNAASAQVKSVYVDGTFSIFIQR